MATATETSIALAEQRSVLRQCRTEANVQDVLAWADKNADGRTYSVWACDLF